MTLAGTALGVAGAAALVAAMIGSERRPVSGAPVRSHASAAVRLHAVAPLPAYKARAGRPRRPSASPPSAAPRRAPAVAVAAASPALRRAPAVAVATASPAPTVVAPVTAPPSRQAPARRVAPAPARSFDSSARFDSSG